MNNVDLFDEVSSDDPTGVGFGFEGGDDVPFQAEMAMPPAGTLTRRKRSGSVPANATNERHYRLAMRAARRLPRSDRRDQTRRLICHHLRCMLEDTSPAHGARR